MNMLKMVDIEEFRDIPEYEGMYQVSNYGRVKSFKRIKSGNILIPYLHKNGYYYVGVSKHNKSKNMKIHQLVAIIFLGYVPDGTMDLVVNHKDENKLNNNILNLEIITHRENVSYSKMRKNSSSKYNGVSKTSSGKYRSRISIDGKDLELGNFLCELKAAYTYNMKSLELFGK